MSEERETRVSRRKFKKRKKVKTKKIPKVKKRYSTRRFKIGLMVLIILVSISGILAMIRSQGTASRVNKIKTSITRVNKRVSSLNDENISYTPELQEFSKRVVDLYMNVPNNSEGQEKRINELKAIYAKGLIEDDSQSKSERKLINTSFLDLKRIDGVNTAKYKVDYQIISMRKVQKEVEEKYKDGDKEKTRKVKKDVEEPTTKNVTNILCIPYVDQNNTLSVIALPYLQAYSAPKSNAKSIAVNEDSTSITNHKIDTFLKAFFKKYATSNKSDMQFLMNNPEALNDSVSFDSYDGQIFKDGKDFTVHADVYFNEKGTDFRRHEHMTLHLVKKDKTFFVKELIHNLGK